MTTSVPRPIIQVPTSVTIITTAPTKAAATSTHRASFIFSPVFRFIGLHVVNCCDECGNNRPNNKQSKRPTCDCLDQRPMQNPRGNNYANETHIYCNELPHFFHLSFCCSWSSRCLRRNYKERQKVQDKPQLPMPCQRLAAELRSAMHLQRE